MKLKKIKTYYLSHIAIKKCQLWTTVYVSFQFYKYYKLTAQMNICIYAVFIR